MKVQSKGPQIIIALTSFILLTPFVAMQFTNEVSWRIMDFIAMGIMLLSVGFATLFIIQKKLRIQYKVVLILSILICFVLAWVELAVGIFNTPIAGS